MEFLITLHATKSLLVPPLLVFTIFLTGTITWFAVKSIKVLFRKLFVIIHKSIR